MDLHGRTALVTGASAGIGTVFAREMASRGAAVVLVARRLELLETLAAELRTAHGVRVDVVSADLSLPGAGAELAEQMAKQSIIVDVLVNNAGFGTHGLLVDEDPSRLAQEVALNVGAVVDLTRAFLPGMVERGAGAVVNVASTAAFQPLPRMAVYGATKAFVLSFTEAVWAETRGTGVRVLALCPGATATDFFTIAGESAQVGRAQSAEDVVALAMRSLARRSGPPSVISGRANAMMAFLPRLGPRRLTLRVAERLMAPSA